MQRCLYNHKVCRQAGTCTCPHAVRCVLPVRASRQAHAVLRPFRMHAAHGSWLVSCGVWGLWAPPGAMYVTVPTRLLGRLCTPSLDSPKSAARQAGRQAGRAAKHVCMHACVHACLRACRQGGQAHRHARCTMAAMGDITINACTDRLQVGWSKLQAVQCARIISRCHCVTGNGVHHDSMPAGACSVGAQSSGDGQHSAQ